MTSKKPGRGAPLALAALVATSISVCARAVTSQNIVGFIGASEKTATSGDFGYERQEGGADIVNYTGSAPAMVIPETIAGLPVTGIGLVNEMSDRRLDQFVGPFAKLGGLKRVVMPGNLRRINNGAFAGCTNLEAVVMAEGVTHLGWHAFSQCTSLTNIAIPNSVSHIGAYAFANCASLSSLAVPPAVTEIGFLAFSHCSALERILVAGDNRKYKDIDGVLFSRDGSLLICCPGGKAGRYTVPAGVTTIEEGAFTGCAKLSAITLPASVTAIRNEAFTECASLTSITIPASVMTIGNEAFSECASLTSITIPASVTAIGNCAFFKCAKLTAVYFEGDAPDGGSYPSLFSNADKVVIYRRPDAKKWDATYGGRPVRVVVPPLRPPATPAEPAPAQPAVPPRAGVPVPPPVQGSVVQGGRAAVVEPGLPFTWSTNDNAITITKYTGSGIDAEVPEKIGGLPVKGISYPAFRDCLTLRTLRIPSGVTTIVPSAFGGCTGLTAFAVDQQNAAFRSNEQGDILSKDGATLWRCPPGKGGRYIVPDSVTKIGNAAFWGSPAIEGVVIHTRVTHIGVDAFNGCTNLAGITLPEGVTEIGYRAFWGCSRVTRVDVPASAIKLWPDTFAGLARLEAITVAPGNPAFSGEGGVLFNKAKALLFRYPQGKAGNYAIPEGVTDVGASAFANSDLLTRVSLPDTVLRIGGYAFAECDTLAEVLLAEGVTHIDNNAFRNCPQLKTIALPASVVSMGPNPFKNCVRLTTLKVHPSNPVYASDAEGVVFDKGGTVLINYPSGRPGHYDVPQGVTKLRELAFEDAGRLTSVTFPRSLERIEQPAFHYCRSLTHICFRSDAPQLARSDALAPASSATIYYPPLTKGWEKTFGGRPTAVGEIKGYYLAAQNRGAWTIIRYLGPGGEVSIPAMIEGVPVGTIGRDAFKNCSAVTGITVPGSVTTIDQWAFAGCTGLAELILRTGVSRISHAAFAGCPGLKRVKLPASITELRLSAFDGCFALEAVDIEKRNPNYRSVDGIILSADGKTVLYCPRGKRGKVKRLPRGAEHVALGAFVDCQEVSQTTLPETLLTLDGWSFAGSGITRMDLPAGVTNIGGNAFARCNRLQAFSVAEANERFCAVDGVLFNKEKTHLQCYPGGRGGDYRVPDGVTSINYSAFERGTNVTSVTIPEGVGTIEAWTFVSCSGLTNATVAASVTNIVGNAFSGCVNMQAMYFKGDAPQIGVSAFANQPRSTIYYRPGTKGWGPEFGGRPTAVWEGE